MGITTAWKFCGGVAGLFALVATSQATVLFSDDFDHGQFATTNYSALTNWTVTSGTVDAFTNGGFGLPCPSLGCLDMDGSTSAAGTIQTNTVFGLVTGDYAVRLNVAGSQRGSIPDSMQIFLGGRLLGSISLPASAPYAVLEIPFTVSAAVDSGPLILDHAGGDNVGILLDRVELHAITNGNGQVPAPGTLALLGLGVAGIGYRQRRRISAA